MHPLIQETEDKIRAIPLTDQGKEEAHYEWQKRKFFHERSKDYWNDQEHGVRKLRKLEDRKP